MGSISSPGRTGRAWQGRLVPMLGIGLELVLAGWIALLAAQAVWLIAFGAGGVSLTINPPAIASSPGDSPNAFGRPDGAVLFADREFGSSEPVETTAPETQLDLTLHGVRLSSEPGSGSAIIRAGGITQGSFGVGDEIMDGVMLAAIHADRITIRRRGVEESVFLREEARRGSTLEGQTNQAADLTQAIRFAPELDNGRLAGFRITPASDAAVLSRAGLQAGDIITRVNGRALTQAADIPALIEQLQAETAVTLGIERDGRTLTLEANLR